VPEQVIIYETARKGIYRYANRFSVSGFQWMYNPGPFIVTGYTVSGTG
jgi:hypothetical protein